MENGDLNNICSENTENMKSGKQKITSIRMEDAGRRESWTRWISVRRRLSGRLYVVKEEEEEERTALYNNS